MHYYLLTVIPNNNNVGPVLSEFKTPEDRLREVEMLTTSPDEGLQSDVFALVGIDSETPVKITDLHQEFNG